MLLKRAGGDRESGRKQGDCVMNQHAEANISPATERDGVMLFGGEILGESLDRTQQISRQHQRNEA
jgi:hypothetical protein